MRALGSHRHVQTATYCATYTVLRLTFCDDVILLFMGKVMVWRAVRGLTPT